MDSSSEKPVARLSELRDGEIKRVEVGATPVILVRDRNTVHAFNAQCPHAGALLEQGAVCNGRLVCPWHKATFDLQSGSLIEPPALEGLTRFDVRIDGDAIRVSENTRPPLRVLEPWQLGSLARRTYAIVGAGAAGASACAALRELGFDGRIVLIDAETTRPYDRTALSKFVPSGELAPDDVYPLLPDDFFHAYAIDTVERRVVTLDAATRQIRFDDGDPLTYDMALVATGSVPRRPPIEGIDDEAVRERVVMLRNRTDAARLDALAGRGGRALVIGGSFIGLETAAALRKRGLDVSVVSPDTTPFASLFGEPAARRIKQLHEEGGTVFHLQSQVERLASRDTQIRAHLSNTDTIDCDFVVIGTGVAPDTEFIQGVARNEDGGLVVDAQMRVAEGLYAAGDIASFDYQGRPTRIEHWRIAQQQGRAAVWGMLGMHVKSSFVPFFWTYHFGKRFDYLGHAKQGDWDQTVVLGSLDALEFVMLYAKDGNVIAALGCDREREMALLSERLRAPVNLAEAREMITGER